MQGQQSKEKVFEKRPIYLCILVWNIFKNWLIITYCNYLMSFDIFYILMEETEETLEGVST